MSTRLLAPCQGQKTHDHERRHQECHGPSADHHDPTSLRIRGQSHEALLHAEGQSSRMDRVSSSQPTQVASLSPCCCEPCRCEWRADTVCSSRNRGLKRGPRGAHRHRGRDPSHRAALRYAASSNSATKTGRPHGGVDGDDRSLRARQRPSGRRRPRVRASAPSWGHRAQRRCGGAGRGSCG